MSSAGQAISQDALKSFRYYNFVEHWGKQVVYLIYRKSFLDGQPKTISEILTDNGVPLEKKFNTHEMKHFPDKAPEELDIAVLHELCQCLWQYGVRDPGHILKGLVKRIKDERNTVCHEGTKISLMDLHDKVADFQDVLEETLLEAESYFKDHGIDTLELDKFHTDMKDDIPKILEKMRENYDPHSTDDMEKLQQEITFYGDQLSEYIVQLSRTELKSNKGLSMIRPIHCLVHYGVTDPSPFIVDLKVDHEKRFHGGSVKEILIRKNRHGKEPKVVLISGDAGSGKTTMISSMVEKWLVDAEDIAGISSFRILFYMQFRSHNNRSFDEYLRNLLPKVTSLFGLELVQASILKSKCLILCDGFDEANPGSETLFKEMISLNFKEIKILVTTRPNNSEKLAEIVDNAHFQRLSLKILGLTLIDMEMLIDKIPNMLQDDDTERQKMKRELSHAMNQLDQRMMGSLKTPLYFNLYILLCIECSDLWKEIRSVTTLHIQLKRHMLTRILRKTRISAKSLGELEKLLTEWSLPNYLNKTYEFSDLDLDKLKSKIQCKEVFQNFYHIMSSYFNVKHRLNLLDTEQVFCYRHRSDQEFTVANIICGNIVKCVQNKEENIFRGVLASTGILQGEQEAEDRRVADLCPFIVGILYISNTDVLYEVISDIHRYLLSDVEEEVDIDTVLATLSEASFDQRVLESLAAALESLPGKCLYNIEKDKNLLPLKSLLPLLNPECVEQLYMDFGPGGLEIKNMPVLIQIVKVANQHCIPVYLNVNLYLEEHLSESSDQPLNTSDLASSFVDELDIKICDNEEVDLSQLHRVPFTTGNLSVWFFTERNIRGLPQILNTIWPRQKAEVTERRENNTSYLMPSKSSGVFEEIVSDHMLVISTDWTTDVKCTDEDIRFVLESLEIRPLTSLIISAKKECLESIKDEESLRELCKRKGLGILRIWR